MAQPWCVYSDQYIVDMGPHVFPVEKYRLTHQRLLAEGTLRADDVVEPQPASEDDLLLVHAPAYLQQLRDLARDGWGFLTPDTPVSAEIVEKTILVAGGTILTGRLALERGLALHLNGGFHHAFADRGEGFCYINDVAVAIRRLQRDGQIERAAIIDCDLHQGNGNAELFGDDVAVFTFSIHDERNYPGIKPPSDLDIGLNAGTGDEGYLEHLRRQIPLILDEHRPDIVLYLAGADPYEGDQLGRLALTKGGLQARDELVIDMCRERAIPVATVLAGGYAFDTDDTVEIHCRTARVIAQRISGGAVGGN